MYQRTVVKRSKIAQVHLVSDAGSIPVGSLIYME